MNVLIAVLLATALIAIQAVIGGAKLVYGLPTYLLIGFTGIVACLARRTAGTTRLHWPCVVATVLFAGYILFRASTSPVEYLARTDFFMTIAAFVVYLVVATRLTQARERVMVLWALLIFALLHVVGGAIQFKQGDNFMMLPWIFRPDYGRRASGFYICPNHLAGLLEMLAVLGLSLVVWGRMKMAPRVILGYLVATCLAGVAITGSRGGYLSTVAGLTVFTGVSLVVVRHLRRKLFFPALGVSIIGVFFAIGAAVFLMSKSVALQQRLDTVYDPQNMRLLLWAASFKQLALSPVFGTGSGTYYFYGRQFRSALVQNDPIHVHNDYLELLCEYGWVGVGLALIFLAVHFVYGWRGLGDIIRLKLKPAWCVNSNELALTVGTLSALSALLVHSMMDFNLHIPANTVFVGALFGLLAQPGPSSREESRPDFGSWWSRFATAGAGAALIAMAAPLIPAEYLGEKARIALRDHQYEQSRVFAEKALAREAKNPDLYYYLGESLHYLALQRPEAVDRIASHQAVTDAFRKGLEVFPQDLRLMLKQGRTLDTLGRFDEAEQLFRRAVTADPNFGNVYAYYGVHMHVQRRFALAEQLYKKAQSLGEMEVAKVGLQDLERDRQRQNLDPFAEFVSLDEEDPATLPIPGVVVPHAP